MSNRSNPKDGNSKKKKKSTKPPSLFLTLSSYNRMCRLPSPRPSFESSISSSSSRCDDDVVLIEESSGEPKEWTALVEPGVQITFVSLPGNAGNEIKRIRFSKKMFSNWQAQRWWGENVDRIRELYNIIQTPIPQPLPAPPELRTTTSSRDEAVSVSASNASDLEVSEWVEQDEPGVYITIRELPDGTRELRRVRFSGCSRERLGEVHAKLWWEDNRERIQAQYL